ncbi:MAG: TraX family protein [Burkholderiales bacterium]
MSTQPLPEEITSYDLLKSAAVVLMVVDHLGYYFFYDDPWWRALGRIGFPVWFFLVGYSAARKIPARLTVSAIVVLLSSALVGLALLPLNALFTIIAIRALIDPLMRFAMHSRARLWLTSAALAAITLPSCALTEYGTMGLITAMFGFVVRNRKKTGDDALALQFMIFALLVFVFYQQLLYRFGPAQFIVMALCTAAMHYTILHFQPRTYPRLTARCPRALTAVLQLCGRWTLEIYVVHLFAFGVLAVLLDIPGMGWFQIRSGLPSFGT